MAGFTSSASAVTKGMKKVVEDALDFSVRQSMSMFGEMKDQKGILPRTAKDGEMITCDSGWWTSGFYPGTLWYCYEYSNDPQVRAAAEEMTLRVEKQKYTTSNHDVGFIINCSFGNALRLAPNDSIRSIIVETADNLRARFNPEIGCIRSWDFGHWNFPVIIDNMMNLDLLFNATRLTGDSIYYKTAVKHAQTTMKHHFRPDYSSYHVISYDTISGQPEKKNTCQGYAHESCWARGQGWALYGYTMMYRETGQEKYLQHATNVARFIMNHPRLPEDKIPYWDFDAPGIPNELRDASAGALMASAFIELSQYTEGDFSKQCLSVAETQLKTLSSPEYLAEPGTNCNFILKHSVGNNPGKAEVDVPLTYADYYYVEALVRYKRDILKEKLH